MHAWNPALYLAFDRERTQPAHNLAARVAIERPRSVLDLGCGPGNSTTVLKARWPTAELTGLDNDPEMLAAAATANPDVRLIQDNAATWQPDAMYDVVFSNAMLQWLPDHAEAVRRFMSAVAHDGALAVQVPTHAQSALHRNILELANESHWRDTLGDVHGSIHGRDPAYYYDVLAPLAGRIELWETEYNHVLAGPEAILMWIRGTGLRPFLHALPDEPSRRRFESELLDRVTIAYPRRPDGMVLFPFRRLFFVAYQK